MIANSRDGQSHKNKYLDTGRNILFQEMLMCNNKALILILEVMTNVHLKKSSNVRVKRFSTNRTILSQEIPMLNMKTLALTVEKLSIKSLFSESSSTAKLKVTC